MENAITAGLSKQIILQRALEVTANNVANQTTTGFKAEHLAFREYIAELDTSGAQGFATDTDVSLVFDPASYTDHSPAALQSTNGVFDFAIDGPGFFAVETGAGTQYTRDGRFSLNAFGELVTQDGARVLDASFSPIFIDPDAGPVVVSNTGEIQQAGTPVGTIATFDFGDLRNLDRTGSNLFTSEDVPTPVAFPILRQGFVETSNVQPIVAMTDMVEILRAYEQTSRLLETASELSRQTVEQLSDTA
ncbi:MAG: flagellar hook-basal body complex protein [Pseudomonadota bacterium]